MGTFYIKLKSDDSSVLEYDSGILGQTTKTYFYPERGFSKFVKIVNEFPEMLEITEIFDENNKTYTPEKFLKKIGKLKIASFNK